MVDFPVIADAVRLERLAPVDRKIPMVLDTDTYNEIDDQFAVVYALLSPERLDVKALYAAPFLNSRSSGPEDGMEKSYEEMLRLLDRLSLSPRDFVYRGSKGFMKDWQHPQPSDAAEHLIALAMSQPKDEALYVVAIGAITNVASAILLEPAIIERIVVVWLGGEPQHWPWANHFNSGQDAPSTHVVFDSGVPLVHVPCDSVASQMLTTLDELEHYVRGRSAVGDYLVDTFRNYSEDHYAWAKEIWDVSAIAWLVNPDWVPSHILPSSILTDEQTWHVDPSRHKMREALTVWRNPIFRDLFRKIETRT